MKTLAMLVLCLILLMPASVLAGPAVSDDSPGNREVREGSRRSKYRFKEYKNNQPAAVSAPVAVPRPVAPTEVRRGSASDVYELYLSETNPEKKSQYFKDYTQLVRSGALKKSNPGSQTIPVTNRIAKPDPPVVQRALSPVKTPNVSVHGALPAAMNWAAPIPASGYLQDTPPVAPPEVKRKKKKGLAKLFRSLEDNLEKALGTTITSTMELMYGLNKDPLLNQRLQRVSGMISRVHDRNIGIRFKLLNMDVVNAFAVPGGTIYLTPKMLDFVNSDSELAFVVGHEVGHIVARHSMKQFEKGLAIDYLIRKTKMDNKEAMQIVNAFLALQYSRKHEFEADRYGFQYISAAGYNPYAAVTFMSKMKNAYEQKKSPKLMTYFSTHPSLHDRVGRNMDMYNAVSAQNSVWRAVNGR